MDTNQGLSVILPAYNEAKRIKDVVIEIVSVVKSYVNSFELIVVNDGSIDETADIIRDLSTQYPALYLIDIPKNKGYGGAIRNGVYSASKQWLLIMDADGQYDINDFKTFWSIKSSYDFIVGFREKRSDNLYRKLLGRLGNLMANLFFKTNIFIKDVDCGFKLFRTSELKTIPILSDGSLISFEVLYKLLQNKKLFTQLPVTHHRRGTGKSTGGKFTTVMKIIVEFINLIILNK